MLIMLFFLTSGNAQTNPEKDSLLVNRNQLLNEYQEFRQNQLLQDSAFLLTDSLIGIDTQLLTEYSKVEEMLSEHQWRLESAQTQLQRRETDFKIMESFLVYLLFTVCLFVILFFVVLTIYLVKSKKFKGLGKEISKLRQQTEQYKQEGVKSKAEIEQLKEKNKAISREMFLLEKSLQEQGAPQMVVKPANESELLELKAMLTVLEARNARLEKDLSQANKGMGTYNERMLAEALEKEKQLHERVREELIHLRQQYYELKNKAGIE